MWGIPPTVVAALVKRGVTDPWHLVSIAARMKQNALSSECLQTEMIGTARYCWWLCHCSVIDASIVFKRHNTVYLMRRKNFEGACGQWRVVWVLFAGHVRR